MLYVCSSAAVIGIDSFRMTQWVSVLREKWVAVKYLNVWGTAGMKKTYSKIAQEQKKKKSWEWLLYAF